MRVIIIVVMGVLAVKIVSENQNSVFVISYNISLNRILSGGKTQVKQRNSF